MLRRERLLLYPLLTLLALLVVADRLGTSAGLQSGANAGEARVSAANDDAADSAAPRIAFAAARNPEPALAANIELASAYMQESAGTVSVRDNRLVWGPGARQRTYTLAFVDLAPLMAPLMDAPDREQARAALRADLTVEEEILRVQIERLADQAAQHEPMSQQYAVIYEEYVRLAEAYEAFEQTAMKRTGQLDAKQLEDVYRIVLAAVNAVADREGIDLVRHRTDPHAAFDAEGAQAAMTAIRLRDTLRIPNGLDITPLVRAELGLPSS